MKTILFLALTSVAFAAEKFPNVATGSTLPHGAGFAAKLHADAKAASLPTVIFADNFGEGELGARWDEKGPAEGKALSFAPTGAEECGKRCLKVELHLGEQQGDGFTKWFESADTLFVRFYVRFDANCDYVHHFVTLRANKGLRGGDKWTGFGGAEKKPAGEYIGPAGK